MFKRKEYTKERFRSRSTKNEPSSGFRSKEIDTRRYPDMYRVYEAFAERFKIPTHNFILTNGGENAARWAFLFFKDRKIHLESPTWMLSQIICEGFGIRYDFFDYKFSGGKFYTEQPDGVVYTTDTFNNLFRHENIIVESGIIDETYTLNKLMDPGRELIENQIIIGSFSKFAGCGLRLGYILFNEKHADFFNLLREQYINGIACDFILRELPFFEPKLVSQQYRYPIVSKHNVYTTYQTEYLDEPHHKFSVDGISFCRIGTKN